MSRLVAITGATGFLGRYIVQAFAERDWRVRILARRPVDHPQLSGLPLDVVQGDLSDAQALRTLVSGADVVVHAAALIKARTVADFETVNVGGTANLARALAQDGMIAQHIVLVSSIAAREPSLSTYARTKHAAEQRLLAELNGRGTLTIVRPCAIYGPWDRETLVVFRALARRLFVRPQLAQGRIALIHAADAAAAIAALCGTGPSPALFELTDERSEGYSWNEIVGAAERAVGSKALVIPLPGLAIRAAAALSQAAARLLRHTPMLTLEKARELLHADWGSKLESQPPRSLWRPAIGLAEGFGETVRWYREQHWLAAR